MKYFQIIVAAWVGGGALASAAPVNYNNVGGSSSDVQPHANYEKLLPRGTEDTGDPEEERRRRRRAEIYSNLSLSITVPRPPPTSTPSSIGNPHSQSSMGGFSQSPWTPVSSHSRTSYSNSQGPHSGSVVVAPSMFTGPPPTSPSSVASPPPRFPIHTSDPRSFFSATESDYSQSSGPQTGFPPASLSSSSPLSPHYPAFAKSPSSGGGSAQSNQSGYWDHYRVGSENGSTPGSSAHYSPQQLSSTASRKK